MQCNAMQCNAIQYNQHFSKHKQFHKELRQPKTSYYFSCSLINLIEMKIKTHNDVNDETKQQK